MMTMSNFFCLICDITLDNSSCVNIFCTSLSHNGELLANFISKVLCINISEICNSYLCSQCYNLFQMLEQAQKTVLNIRCEILNIYHVTERRKIIKQSASNDTNFNLSTNIVLEENNLHVSNDHEHSKEGLNLQSTQLEGIIKQQYVQDKISRIVNVQNTDHINNKVIEDTEKNNISDCNEICGISLFKYNNSENGMKKDEILKNDVLQNSVILTNANNVCSINNSEANIHVSKMTAQEKNYISSIDSGKDESKDFLQGDSIFPNDKLQIKNISQSTNLKWKEINENIIEVKENTESSKGKKIDKLNVPIKPGKISKHSLKPLKYSCPTCSKKWKTLAELNTHVKTHSTLRPYMCEKCGQAYKHKHALEIHVGMHNGINPFQCTFCKKCFTQKGALMRHLPMHTGEMPYQCELCGKRFIHHTSYNMHRLSHTGKKSYKCDMCDLSLLSMSHLKRHMRVHTGEKPYSCTLCGKRFAERYNLFAHQKIHDSFEGKTKKSNKSQYQCNHCNLMFEQKQTLNDHLKCHNDMDTETDQKTSYSVFQVEETNQLSKKIDSECDTFQQTWIQMNRSKLNVINNEAKFVLLQNPLPEIDENAFAVTFNNKKVSLEGTNYNTNLQVIIEPTETSLLSNNHSCINKTHM